MAEAKEAVEHRWKEAAVRAATAATVVAGRQG
jgi:hypothetical protein